MPAEPEFRTDLYRGTARFYDAFRVGYPRALFDDLLARAGPTGAGRLLDVACGTGQITFELASSFAEVWAIDQEPEAIEVAREKARERGVDNVRFVIGRAEDIGADTSGDFDLVTIGNAFHRLPRRAVAESVLQRLGPGGHLALAWSDSPWVGTREWQGVMAETMHRWERVSGATDRVPANLWEQLDEEPHAAVLAAAGLAVVGAYGFEMPYEWTFEQLAGFVYSTSVLSQPALGSHVEAFERDLRERLLAVQPDGGFRQDISTSYTLARRGE